MLFQTPKSNSMPQRKTVEKVWSSHGIAYINMDTWYIIKMYSTVFCDSENNIWKLLWYRLFRGSKPKYWLPKCLDILYPDINKRYTIKELCYILIKRILPSTLTKSVLSVGSFPAFLSTISWACRSISTEKRINSLLSMLWNKFY